jgi:GNAT superfamily N-acetyltransferase
VESARPAATRDAARLAQLWDMASDELCQVRGGTLLLAQLDPRPPEITDDPGGDPSTLLAVGTYDDVVVGLARVRAEPIGSQAGGPPRLLGVVEVFYVEPEARTVGVGEAIMDLVRRWAVERGCIGLDATALPGSRSTKAFFEDQGFVARLLIMHRPLDQG